MSNEEYRQLLENDVDVKLKEAELDKQYSDKLEKILSPEKLYRAQQAERKFMQQEVMKLRHLSECSIEEIEQITGLNAINIRVLISRARKTIREQFNILRQ
jgi:DNA-directed RNA polymerase specialized sigma24 family protein